MNRRFPHAWILASLILMPPLRLFAAEVHVAVAANFAAPMKAIVQDFERATGHRVLMSTGATGQLYAQIRHGAPFSVLLAADEETPARLEKEGLAVSGTRFAYAFGKLVLWSKEPGLVDDQGAVLRGAAFEKIALANPKLAPYGAATVQALDALGLRERLTPHIVEGANITQTYQFVATGNARLGFVALSQVMEKGQLKSGSLWVLPASLYSRLQQDAVLLKLGEGNPAATALLRHLQSAPTKAVIRSFGYER